MEPNKSEQPEAIAVGLAFARALVEGRFHDAHDMLAPSLRDDFQSRDLEDHYRQMTEYWDAPADPVDDADATPGASEWPDKEPNDLGWVYVSIGSKTPQGGVNLEAVFVRVANVSERHLITQIEWGRP